MLAALLIASRRNVVTVALATALVTALALPAHAKTTELADDSGVLRIAAEGTWREQKGATTIAAHGFLGGTKRAELFAVLYTDLTTADAAARRWKEWRTKNGGEPVFADAEDAEDATRWTAHSVAAGTVEYVRALAGAGKAAVVWVRVNGAPGVAAGDAKTLLDAAGLAPPEPETPKTETPAGAGATDAGGASEDGSGDAGTDSGGALTKDPDFRIAIRLPEGFTVRKDVQPAAPRVISAIGPVGTDAEAFLDVYVFDEFLRADACGKWWREAEQMGWHQGVHVAGDATSFKVEVRDETWTRHVRVVRTDAGVVGLKLDVASQAEDAALATMDALLASLQVLKARPDVPTPPPGMKVTTSEKSIVQAEELEGGPEPFQFEADVVEEHVTAITGIPAPTGAKAVVRVYADAVALASALRPLGISDDREAEWWVREGAVLTHGGALSTPAGKAALRLELTRAALQRRLGFRAPFWIEHGVGQVVASAAYNKGRIDQSHPLLVRAVHDAAPSGVELQTVRWWTHAESATHPEREAVAWSYVHFFLHGGAAGRKWVEMFRAYMKALQSSGDPVAAAAAFDFSRETELAEDWQLWARKL